MMFYVLDVGKLRENRKRNQHFKCYFETRDLRRTIAQLIDRYYDIPTEESMTYDLMWRVSVEGCRILASDYEIEIYTSEITMLNRFIELALEEEV